MEAEKKRDKTREEEAKTLQELEKLRKVPLLLSLNKKKTKQIYQIPHSDAYLWTYSDAWRADLRGESREDAGGRGGDARVRGRSHRAALSGTECRPAQVRAWNEFYKKKKKEKTHTYIFSLIVCVMSEYGFDIGSEKAK